MNKNKNNYKIVMHEVVGALLLTIASSTTISAVDLFGNNDTKKTTSSSSKITDSISSSTGSSIGSINGTIDQALSNISGIKDTVDGIFQDFNPDGIMDSITGDNEILGCLAQEIDIDKVLQGATGSLPDGICSLVSTKNILNSSILSGSLYDCVSGETGADETESNTNDLFQGLEGLCAGIEGMGSSTDTWGNIGGGATSSGSIGGGWGAQKIYSSASVAASSTETSTVGRSGSGKSKSLAEVKYPSGKTVYQIEGEDGGAIAKKAKEDPTSPTGVAYAKMDVPTLELKKLAEKITGGKPLDERKVGLPSTPLDVIKMENATAQIQQVGYPNLHALQAYIARGAREKYSSLSADTLTEYYKKEKEEFNKFVSDNTRVAALKNAVFTAIESKYNLELFVLKGKKGYLPDVSEDRAKRIPQMHQNQFRFDSIIQMNKNALIKGKIAKEKEEANEAIDRAISQAYAMSSIFRGDIAKKEIDALLNAVDTAIK